MPVDRLVQSLATDIETLAARGTAKGAETVFAQIVPPAGKFGPRYRLQEEARDYLRMNSNSYLGLARHPDILDAETQASERYGAGPGAVRFISGTWAPHIELERRLGEFHGRDASMIFSSAYATVMGVLTPLISDQTAVISDALNHNSIINALRLARPLEKHVYDHLDLKGLTARLEAAAGAAKRALVITDGIFSMRGDHAPIDQIVEIARRYDDRFEENVIVVVDDSHGVGAFGDRGRGTEEVANARADILIATLGKAIGVNGGYVAGAQVVVDYLRETSPFYIYSNPITPGEAAAAKAALDLIDTPEGVALLAHLREMTAKLENGLVERGYETIPGSHPIVPLVLRDTPRTAALVAHLRANGILATGLNFPVVPKGEEEIRFQISADHTAADIELALDVLAGFED